MPRQSFATLRWSPVYGSTGKLPASAHVVRNDQNGSVARLTACILTGILFSAACGGRTVETTAADPGRVDVSQLWNDPVDLERRDLFAGVQEGTSPPAPTTPFEFIEADSSGFSPGYDVRDASGVEWSVKLGPEAQTEVVASRILWAIGFHQVPTYFLSSFTMTGGPDGDPGPGRFRPELKGWTVVDDWSWYENDFANTQPFKGLIVANLLLNNWDWKTSNNKIYEITRPDGTTERRYIVRDLGASLGKTSSPAPLRWLGTRIAQGNRNDLEDFEKQGFIEGVEADRVDFDYSGIYQNVVDTVRVSDVVWTARLLSRLSDAQWNDAFRAAGYPPDHASRYITKIKSKIAEGLALAQRATARSSAAARAATVAD